MEPSVPGSRPAARTRPGGVAAALGEAAGRKDPLSLVDVVAVVQSIPYGRPTDRTVAGVLADWTGTCSTKHSLLVAALAEGWPDTEPQLVHRVYSLSREQAAGWFGAEVAAHVPAAGLVDVHRYCVVRVEDERVVLDVTFPGTPPWSGRSSMAVQCGPGSDFPAQVDPDVEKRALEDRFCEPAVREPFIAALVSRQSHSRD